MINIRIVQSKDDGGIRQSERQYIPELKKLGVEVVGIVIGEEYGNYSDQIEDFPLLHDLNQVDFKGSPLTKIRKLIKSIQTAKAHSKMLKTSLQPYLRNMDGRKVIINIRRVNLLPLAYFLGLKLKAKVVYHSGGSFLGSKLSAHYLFYYLIQKLPYFTMLANSKFSAQSYGLRDSYFVYPGFSSERSVAKTQRCNNDIKEKLGVLEDSPVFLYLARINYDKAPDILVEAFINSKEAEAVQATLILAGPIQSEELLSRIQGLIENSKIENRVFIVGPQKEVGEWFKIADVFVNSRRGVEPFGISIVEAMANSLPILTSGYGGPTETVSDRENGWLVKDLSVDGYRKAIDIALMERNEWVRYGSNSLLRSEAFSTVVQVAQYVDKVY